MNIEDAISMVKGTIERLSVIVGGGLYPDEKSELLEAFAALRVQQPNPKTDGCEGVIE
jgi:glyoxylate carboligase